MRRPLTLPDGPFYLKAAKIVFGHHCTGQTVAVEADDVRFAVSIAT